MRAQSTTCEYAREAGDDHLRFVFERESLDFVVIDQSFVIDAVLHGVEELAGEIDLRAVRQMSAVRERHAEHRVARLEQREVNGLVGLRARVRLHVRVVGAEQLLRRARSRGFSAMSTNSQPP